MAKTKSKKQEVLRALADLVSKLEHRDRPLTPALAAKALELTAKLQEIRAAAVGIKAFKAK
jgi:hypothetical protein